MTIDTKTSAGDATRHHAHVREHHAHDHEHGDACGCGHDHDGHHHHHGHRHIAPFVRSGPKIGRNDPCPCGSGKKYKKCCLAA